MANRESPKIDISKKLEEVEQEYKSFNMNCTMQPSIKVEQAFKYLMHMLSKKIGESEAQERDKRDHEERFFLFECRDVLAYMLYIQENPDTLDEQEEDDEDEDDEDEDEANTGRFNQTNIIK